MLALVGAVMVVGGARRDPLRTIAGVVVSGMCVSAMASAVSLGAGGLVGDASGGAIAQGAGAWVGLFAGGAVLLFSLWLYHLQHQVSFHPPSHVLLAYLSLKLSHVPLQTLQLRKTMH